jgi:hypothetical protein
MVRQAFVEAVAYLETDSALSSTIAIVARSHMVGGALSERLGLETRPIASPLLRLYTDLIGRLYILGADPSSRGWRKVLLGPLRQPKEGWISKNQWIRLHSTGDARIDE